jgi:hypothetical protein
VKEKEKPILISQKGMKRKSDLKMKKNILTIKFSLSLPLWGSRRGPFLLC